MDTPLLLSIPECSRMLGIGRSKTYELMNDGVLETVVIGRRRLVRATSVEALAVEGAPRK